MDKIKNIPWQKILSVLPSFLTGPQNPKKLNPDLISPGFKKLFAWWPKFIRSKIDELDIGSEFVSPS